ncbi:MAG: L-tyrosine/L-tryptophan isonitrile synthase family protein [Myxococcota bacterium]
MLRGLESILRYETTWNDPQSEQNQLSHPREMSDTELATFLLADVMRFRRMASSESSCESAFCQECQAPHLQKVLDAITQQKPITFVLPAFPGKSPNTAKVFGTLPDMAERCALEFLQSVCDRIQRYYAPGAQIILCSDGRAFSDVVGMRDEDVTAYQDELAQMIERLNLTSLTTFNLEELYSCTDYDALRTQLMAQYGESLEALKASVSRGKAHDASIEDREANRLYCGITRFLVEDAMHPGQTRSRTNIQKDCRVRSYLVIQRSKAWGELIAERFPEAIRLSIHPQSCGSKKLGIRLIEPDQWQTPWHGVAVQVGARFVLLKRAQAEALGGHLVMRFGRPSHFVLPERRAELDRPGALDYSQALDLEGAQP